jgi:hypothetical protein
MSLALYEELLELGDPARFEALFVLVAVRLAAPFVREELFLLASPRWEVFATQLPFSPITGRLDLRDPACKVLADTGVGASYKYI